MNSQRMERSSLLRVAHPRARNNATTDENDGPERNKGAPATQQTGLRALALLGLARNSDATGAQQTPATGPKTAQQSFALGGDSVARELRQRLTAAGMPEAWLSRDHGDPADLASLDDAALRDYVSDLQRSDLRRQGKVPLDETARALCRHCGPVWVAPELAAMAPSVGGWPVVLGCPWCFVKDLSKLPRPTVSCGDCAQFVRDNLNPDGGIGRCTAGRQPCAGEPATYPHADRQCSHFTSSEGAPVRGGASVKQTGEKP